MDPNEALTTMRGAVAPFRNAQDTDEEYAAATALVDAFAALDEWLTKGGFLPRDWQPPAASGDDPRFAHRLEAVLDRAMRDDEQLDKLLPPSWRERERIARLLAQAVVKDQQAVEAVYQRMASYLRAVTPDWL